MNAYPTRELEFRDCKTFSRVPEERYLDELGEAATGSLGVGVVKLVIEPENQAFDLAKSLISQAKEEINEQKIQQDLRVLNYS